MGVFRPSLKEDLFCLPVLEITGFIVFLYTRLSLLSISIEMIIIFYVN
jgi:hypothetical protein